MTWTGPTPRVRGLALLRDHTEARPLEYTSWTPPQLEYLTCRAPRKLLRAGNQLGKTWAGLADVVFRALGNHPYQQVRQPPVEIWVVCTTWPQSVAIMGKFWSLVPKHEIRSPKSFDPRYGFGKDNPAVVFRNGSVVRFRTTNQGAEALAGATIDHVHIDEPTDEPIYRELDRRLLRRAGTLGATLTPINRPTEYLRELVQSGGVTDIHARMTAANLTPVGWGRPMALLDGTLMDDEWIAQQRKLVLPRYAPVILDGEWEMRVEGSVFAAFDPDVHVSDRLPEGEVRLHVGIDHGEGDYREVAVVSAVDDTGDHPRVAILAEYTGDGTTLPDVDAEGILDALASVRLRWADLDGAIGDKPTQGKIGRRSNADLTKALERHLRNRGQLRAGASLSPQIRTAKTGVGVGRATLWRGCEWLHRAMLRPGHFSVHPRCVRTVESLTKWDGSDSQWKDACDAVRYSTWRYAVRNRAGGVVVPVVRGW